MLKFGIFKGVDYLCNRIKIPNLKHFKMKKVFAILAIAALTACGGASTEAKTDTAAAAATVDTAAAVTVDTAAAATVDTAAKAK